MKSLIADKLNLMPRLGVTYSPRSSKTIIRGGYGLFYDWYESNLYDQTLRVNGIAPSLMLRSPGQSEENFAAMQRANPLGSAVGPGDVVTALRYLIDSPAVTGEVLTIDGGQRFWSLGRDVQFLEKA